MPNIKLPSDAEEGIEQISDATHQAAQNVVKQASQQAIQQKNLTTKAFVEQLYGVNPQQANPQGTGVEQPTQSSPQATQTFKSMAEQPATPSAENNQPTNESLLLEKTQRELRRMHLRTYGMQFTQDGEAEKAAAQRKREEQERLQQEAEEEEQKKQAKKMEEIEEQKKQEDLNVVRSQTKTERMPGSGG